MISLSSALHEDLAKPMQSRGGFCWWYADLIDDEGDGVVLIWSFGLPFLPGARDAVLPTARPALSVAAYRGGRAVFYLLQELQPDDVEVAADRWRFGDSVMSIARRGTEQHLVADLNASIPATKNRLVGRVVIGGAPCTRRARSEASEAVHTWMPLMAAARGSARLRWGAPAEHGVTVHGRGYLDSNASTLPLHELGIRDWQWGRVTLGRDELIYYVVRPSDPSEQPVEIALRVAPDGKVQRYASLVVRGVDSRRGIYGLAQDCVVQLTADAGEADEPLDVTIRVASRVDDGPFYVRSLVRVSCARTGVGGRGFAERVVPDRVDIPWQRTFVRMRRHVVGGPNSLWLPLFSGQRDGRFGRLVSQLWSEESRV